MEGVAVSTCCDSVCYVATAQDNARIDRAVSVTSAAAETKSCVFPSPSKSQLLCSWSCGANNTK